MNKNNLPNRLINEKSPYLLQHAHHPVDWFPWGEEAFTKALKEDKPVFLSIGYSTCHWCHVMAEESFEDPDVASLLNDNFISIKVDREERPDVDAVYMEVCQARTGSGGWPLTIIMTGEKKPFFAGTYFPKHSGFGRKGLMDILTMIAQQWKKDRGEFLHSGEWITQYLQKHHSALGEDALPEKSLLHAAREEGMANYFDPLWGGFHPSPKFPIPSNLIFLLRYSAFEQDKHALYMAEHTLTQMYRGGIFDHIGGGFSRYSTDEKWLIPHFEKMLYDNAQLIWVYAEAYALTSRPLYKRVAEKTIDYVLRELRHEDGAFLSAQDADSDGIEGKYYAFTSQEILSILGEKAGVAFCRRFGIRESGNFHGQSIPNLIDSPDFEEEDEPWRASIDALYAYRRDRTTLRKDDKILTSWNSLMILALARAGQIFGNEQYIQSARQAQEFLSKNLIDSSGRLYIRWREGEAVNDGQLEDYSLYGLALLELYAGTLDITYLQQSIFIGKEMLRLFRDEGQGGLFMYAEDGEQLILRPKPIYDGALPSGNSAAALLLQRLSSLTGEKIWREAAQRQLKFIASLATKNPRGHSFALLALMEALYPSVELLCASSDGEVPETVITGMKEAAALNVSVLLKTRGNENQLKDLAPFTSDYPLPEQGTLYYLCRDHACSRPTENPEEILTQITDYQKQQ